jgi:nitrate/TMAO reductase-like tetraheme cytochrome c subunit
MGINKIPILVCFKYSFSLLNIFCLTNKKQFDIICHVNTEEYPSPAEGIGLENRQAVRAARGFESLFLRHNIIDNSAYKLRL